MNQRKSPGGNQGKAGRKEKLDSFYPAAPGSVNRECRTCNYFRSPDSGNSIRRFSSFCAFDGEKVPPGWPGCEFWILAGGES
jgi:hypothetical protein